MLERLPAVREVTPFGRLLARQVSEEYWLLSSFKNPPIVQVNAVSGYLHCLLNLRNLEFSSDLTV